MITGNGLFGWHGEGCLSVEVEGGGSDVPIGASGPSSKRGGHLVADPYLPILPLLPQDGPIVRFNSPYSSAVFERRYYVCGDQPPVPSGVRPFQGAFDTVTAACVTPERCPSGSGRRYRARSEALGGSEGASVLCRPSAPEREGCKQPEDIAGHPIG